MRAHDQTKRSGDVTNISIPESLSRAIIESADVAIISENLDGVILLWNGAAERLFGYGAEEAIGKSSEMLIPPDMTQESDLLVRVGRGERVEGYETLRQAKDGRRIAVSLTVSPIEDGQGKVVGASTVARDITEQQELERTRAHFAALVESAHDAIVSKSLEGVIQSWNKGAERLFGYTAEEAIGRSITMLIPPGRTEEEPEILARIAAGERVDHYQTVRVTKDGRHIPISLTVSPIRNARGVIIGASKIARDASERVAAEQALRDAERRKDEFLAMLAHELRNPLTPIRTGLDVIQKNLGDQQRREWALQVVDRQLVQLTRVIDDLLELARIVNGDIALKKEVLSLRTLVSNAVDASRALINTRRQKLRVDVPLQDINLHVDPVRMGQAIGNLLSNAAKYTDAGGTISVAAHTRDGALTIRVQDTGRGIDERVLPHIFDSYVQGERDYARSGNGLGIGLSIVRRIVELHGGSVSAHSRGPNLGSEFSIKLPLPAEVPVPGLVRPEIAAERGQRRRVLIVDDNRDATDIIAEYLRLNGQDVAQHYQGDGVIERALAFTPDAIVLDLGLPGKDGFTVARELREHPALRHVPIVAISGYGQPADVERTKAAGIDFHMVKPIDAELLMNLIEKSLAN